MPNTMLIDAAHPKETRVVVVRGNRVEEFDFETAQRKQLRGNIYLAKVTRVEPSLQAAFVEYGGNRHGFLALSEIHPDYYQIPIADRQALIEADERAHREAEEEDEHRHHGRRRSRPRNSRRRDRGERVQSAVVGHTGAEAPAPADHDQPYESEAHATTAHHDHDGHEHEHDHAHEHGHEAHDAEHAHHDDHHDHDHDHDDAGHAHDAAPAALADDHHAETPVAAAVESSIATALNEPLAPEFNETDGHDERAEEER